MAKVYFNHKISLADWRRRATATHWAIIAALLVLMVPIMLLGLAALLVGIIVFTCVGLVLRFVTFVRNLLSGFSRGTTDVSEADLSQPDSDGRVNVRVLRHGSE